MLRNILLLVFCCTSLFAGSIEYPETKEIPVVNTYHGEEIIDEYQWLEDSDDPEVQEWQSKQNNLTKGYFKKLNLNSDLQKETDSDKEFICEKENSYFHFLGDFDDENDVSSFKECFKDGRDYYCTYIKDYDSIELRKIYIVDMKNQRSVDVINSWAYDDWFRWHFKDIGFYYRSSNHTFSYYSIPSKKNVNLFKSLPEFGVDKFHYDGNDFLWLVDNDKQNNISSLYFKRLNDNSDPTSFNQKINFDIGAHVVSSVVGDDVVILSTQDAPKGKVLFANIFDNQLINFREIVPACDDLLIQVVNVQEKYLVVFYLKDGAYTYLKVYDFNGKLKGSVGFPKIGILDSSCDGIAESFFHCCGDYEGDMQFEIKIFDGLNYDVYEFDVERCELSFKRKKWGENNLESKDEIVLEQVWFKSTDGTLVPMSIFRLSGCELFVNGDTPVLLTGYGSFGERSTSMWGFNWHELLWLRSGGIIAIPSIRGGGDYGLDWINMGHGKNRQNTIDDFISAANWLIENKWTSHEKLVIHGASAGGWLVSIAAIQQPHLFKAVWSDIPCLDIIRFQSLISKTSISALVEIFSDISDPKMFPYIKYVCPYYNIKREKYPAMLFTAGGKDPRCVPGHARKMVARLQKNNIAKMPIYLLVDENIGHGSSEIVDLQSLAFLMDQVGILSEEVAEQISERIANTFDH